MRFKVSPAFAIVLVDSLPVSISLRFSSAESIFFQRPSTASSLATRIWRSNQMLGRSITLSSSANNLLFLLLYSVYVRHTNFLVVKHYINNTHSLGSLAQSTGRAIIGLK